MNLGLSVWRAVVQVGVLAVGVAVLASLSVEASAAESLPVERWEPPAVYLTWQRDPSTTMTVHWHAWPDRPGSVVRYRPADRPDAAWSTAEGESRPIAGSERRVHTAEITGLEPDTAYVFQPGLAAYDFRFSTLPAGPTRPIRFVASGCVYKVGEVFTRLADRLAARSPDFALLSGDIAYANATIDNAPIWFRFLELWKRHMVKPDGGLVPMVWAIGNHEVAGGYGQPRDAAPFFYDLIAFPEPGYGVLDLGDYLSLVVLDSGHTNPVAGAQTDWLERTLSPRRDVPHLFATHHVPAYPSARDYGGWLNRRIRKHWVPLFESHGVDVVFEAHDHCYKRTHPIRGGRVDESGIVYIGDGGWATDGTRTPAAPGERWYLAATSAANHATLVTLDGDVRTFEPIDVHGNTLETPYRMTAGLPVTIKLTGGAGSGLPWWLWVVIAGGAAVAVVVTLLIVRRSAKRAIAKVLG